MVFLKQYFFFLLGIFVLSGVFAFGNVSFAASCTFNDSSTGKSYSGECRSNAAGCGTNELSKDDSTGACSAAGVGLWDCCVPNTTTFYCGTGGEGTCKDACASGDTAVSGSGSQCASLTVTKGKCCKAASSTGASCSGKDSSGATQSGTCSTTATCSTGTALTGATGCAGGMACCFSSTGTGTGTSTGSSCTGSQNAGIVPCGRSCDNPATTDVDESAICTLCHLFLLMKNITSWIFMVMTYIAFAVLVAMGVFYIISAGNTQMIGIAKSGIKAALYGFAIVLLGWVAINVILMVLADGALGTDTAAFSFKTNGSWFTYSCDAKSKYVRTGISGVTGGGGTTTGGGATNPGGNGTCDTTTSGPCSVDSLKSTCFSSNAEAISRLCNKESKGDPGSKSGVDICTNYGNRSFSGGLFQINVFSNGSQLGDSRCSNLGSKGSCANRRSSDNVCLGWNCQINNISDFDYCMGLTLSAAPNIKVACALSNNGSNLTPWACSANKCGLGGTSSNFCK